jgi:hypothetical protein
MLYQLTHPLLQLLASEEMERLVGLEAYLHDNVVRAIG